MSRNGGWTFFVSHHAGLWTLPIVLVRASLAGCTQRTFHPYTGAKLRTRDPDCAGASVRIRDGVFSAGNYSAQSQFFQTLHGKRLIGGYLSRISKRRIDETRTQPTLHALLVLSEGQILSSDEASRIKSRARRFLSRSDLGYVVIDHGRASKALIEFVVDAWRLRELEQDGIFVPYEPTLMAGDAAGRSSMAP